MGNLMSFFFRKEPPPPMVLAPPIFDFPPLAARTRKLVPAYDLLFGKLALHFLFEDYFEQARNLNTRILLKPLEDTHVDLDATKVLAGTKSGEGTSLQMAEDSLSAASSEPSDPKANRLINDPLQLQQLHDL